jgi:phage FluMu protein gp41
MKTTIQKRRQKEDAPANLASLRQGRHTTTMAEAALVPVDRPLTEMQKLFVRSWAEGDSIPVAMQRAGYNEQPSWGYRLAKMPNILAEYDRVKKLYEEAAQMTRKKVMDMHLEAFEMAKLLAEPATMVSAAREIGRMCGYYEPVKQKLEISVNGQIAVKKIESLSDDDLIKLVTEGMVALQAPAGLSTNPDDPDSLGEDDHDPSS